MKKFWVVLFMVALSTVASGFGIDVHFLKTTVPFGFVAGEQMMPAGEYILTPMLRQGVVLIREVDGNGSGFAFSCGAQRHEIPEVISTWTPGLPTGAQTTPSPEQSQAAGISSYEYSVTFHKYGDQYFISQMWMGLKGQEFPPSRLERQITTANASIKHETVVLAATMR